MTVAQSVLTILAVVAATMLTRFLPFLIFPEGKTPPAVFTGWHGLPELLAIVFTAALHKWKKNTLLSIAGGTIAYMILVQNLFR